MRHLKQNHRLGVEREHRQALMANLAVALITHGRIQATLAMAKALRPFIEKIITMPRQLKKCDPSPPTAPGGHGEVGEQGTRQNDRRILDLIESAAAEMILPEVREHANACGAGAIVATNAACKAMGATRGICLEYTNSYEIVHKLYPADPDDTTPNRVS